MVNGEPLFLCSCSGRRDSKAFVFQVKFQKSTTCKHVAGLRIAHEYLASELRVDGLGALHAARPTMATRGSHE